MSVDQPSAGDSSPASVSPKRPRRSKRTGFRVDVTYEDDVACVTPVGELDLATVDVLDEQLRDLRAEGVDRLVLDLRGLAFMDSTGLNLVIRWITLAGREGFTFDLIQGGAEIERLFSISGLLDRLPFVSPTAADCAS